jgi:hypothetical protein
METSGKAFVEHWDWVTQKGLMNKNTAGALRAAAKQVLSIEDDPDGVDITKIDVEALLRRWENLRKQNFKPDSLETYKQRFRQALSLYTSYLEDPGGYKPSRPRPSKPERTNGKKVSSSDGTRPATEIAEPPQQRGRVMDYPFPLREGVIAHLYLPVDLRASEVKRLNAFMNTLVAEEASAI